MNELEQKVRRLINISEEPLKLCKLYVWNDECEDDPLYIKIIQSLILIDEIKKELEKKDPRSSKKFTQKKLF